MTDKKTDGLIGLMTDFPNKYIYYPLANLLYYPFSITPITPTQVTVIHTIMAFVGAWFLAQGTDQDLMIAFILYQTRAVLDCLDGTIARRKNMSSDFGRNLDMLGDSIGFLCLTTGFYFYFRSGNQFSILQTIGILLLNTAISGVMAQGTDHFRRKFSAALKEDRDIIVDEITRKHRLINSGEGTFLIWFAYLNDWFQILVFNPGSIGRLRRHLKSASAESEFKHDVETIRKNPDSALLKFTMFMVGMMSGDVAIFIVLLGLPVGRPLEAMAINMIYGLVTIVVVGILMARLFRAKKLTTSESR